MFDSSTSRRSFLGVITAGAYAADEGWKDLFDGKSLDGWRPGGNRDSWKVVDGELSGDGPTSHLFYNGGVYKIFELEAEAMARIANARRRALCMACETSTNSLSRMTSGSRCISLSAARMCRYG